MILMKRSSLPKASPPLPEDVHAIIKRLGERIRAARVRRKLRQEDLAAKTGLSRSFIQSVERGQANCFAGGLITILWTLGLANEIELIADPGLDRDGLALALSREKKRVFIPRKLDNAF
jgi:transcriptional regulator with XRE-family HTH domain